MPSLMKSDIARRIEKIHLDSFNVFMPLFEAISNSLQAIDDQKKVCSEDYVGKIKISLSRRNLEENQLPIEMQAEDFKKESIKTITIYDDGIGFTDENFESFLTYDSRYKKLRGGKGEGRLYWLAEFDNAQIESQYIQNNKTYQRNFDFSVAYNGVDDKFLMEKEIKNFEKSYTIIHLRKLKNKFAKFYNITLESIANKIISHFMCYFLNNKTCPQIILEDDFDSININSHFNDLLLNEQITESNFNIDNNEFALCYLKLKSNTKNIHKLHLCADNREVKSIYLKDYIPNFMGSFKENDNGYYYQVILTGEYLNQSLNADRSSFYIDNSSLILNTETIIEQAIKQIKNDLSYEIKKVEESKIKKIKSHITRNSPQYRILMSNKYKDFLENINPTSSGTKLEMELYDQYYQINREAKKTSSELLAGLSKKLDDVQELKEFQENFKGYVEQINDVGKSKLADYVAYRKAILELLSKLQKKNNEGKYPLEKAIHEIIFPMNTTSDDIDYEKHNLWTIDERLAYHYYLASDKKLSKVECNTSKSEDRPDILIYNNPFLFTDNEKITTATIIEFKRPEREDYTKEENPIDQVINYVKELRKSEIKNKDGETINLPESVPIYAYIISTLTPKLIEIAEDSGYLTPAPDKSGYFGFHRTHKIYFEIISYKKMIQDAKDRNKILFSKLNLV